MMADDGLIVVDTRPSAHPAAEKEVVPSSLPEHYSEAGPSRRARWFGGWSRKTRLLALGLAALAVIGAVLGGVLGTVLPRRNTAATPSQEPAEPSGVLANSSLSAANWTDASNVAHRAVFFQDPSGALMASIWDSRNTTWTVVNITASVQRRAPRFAPAALPGTPLAATARPGPVLTLYYLAARDYVSEAYAADGVGAAWEVGGLTYAPEAAAARGSRLAALAQRCCGIVVAFAGADGGVRLANWTDGAGPWAFADAAPSADADAGLALAAYAETGMDPAWLRLYYGAAGRLAERIQGPDYGWAAGACGCSPLSCCCGQAVADERTGPA